MKQFLQLTRQYSLLVLLLLTMNVGWGQVTLVEYQFENNLNPESGSIGSPNLTFSIAPTYNTGATGQSLVTGTAASANGAFIELTISTTGYQDIEVSWAGRTSNNLNPGAWQLTANSGSGFGGVIFTQSLTTSFNNTGFQSLGSAFNNNSTVTIRITANNPQPRNLRIDDLIIRGVVLTSSPSISVNPTSLSNLNYVVGSGPSTSKSYEVSAANLVGAGNITVTAPTNFEISTDNVNFFATRNLPFAGGLITGQPVTVYVRLVESLAINSYNGIITHFGGTAPQVDLAVSGAVISPPGWQITAANSNFTIDFDNTVSGVNNGAFSANNPAASQSPLSGQLDTDAWEYNIDGTSSSVLNAASFPGSFPVSVGPNNGGLLATGINVVEIPAAQGGTGRAFAVQPTGGHWTAGHITLRAQNKTGVPITSFLISYDAYYFNDQARSNEFFFLYSTDNITYTRVSALDVVSPEAAAGTPEWVQNSRSTLISSLNIPTDGYLYLRWAGDDISGSGSRDEFAFDNIVLNLNPSTTNFYYSGSGDLTNTSNWGTNTDGSGTNPANFTNGLQVFNIRNTASVSLSSTWTVSGSGSKVVVGDGTSATTFTIPSFHALSGAIDVSDNTTLAIENSTFPTLGDLNAGSTVIYRGLTNINLPLSAYGNLTFDNTSVADPGDNNNLNYRGNFSLINGATFNCAGINLQATGTGNQTITGNGNTLTVRSFDRNGNAVKTSGRLILAANTPITVSNSIIMNNSGAANRFEDGGNTITVFNNVTLDGNADGYLFTGTLRFAGDTDNSNLRADGTNNVAAKGELNNLVIAKEGTRTMGIRGNVASEVTTIKGNFVVESTSTGSLFFNEGMIRVGGDFIYSSSTQDLNVSTSTVVLNGTSSQTINFSQNRSLNAFTINKLSGTATISGAGELVVSNVLTLASGTLNTGNRLVLRSSSTNTARVAPIGVGASITGNVAVERYIPAKRAWRLLASPVRGENNSIFANWQNNGTDNGRGLLLWHPSPVGTATPTSSNSGLFVGAQPNIYSYVNGAWAAVTNTNTTNISSASNNNAFMVFVTGPHASNNFTTTSAVTTSVASGQLITGNVNHSIVANQFTLLGNPYASPINPVSLVSNNSGSKLWMLDPSVGLGAYVTYDGNEWVPEAPSGNDAYIQSGQGFFVRSTQTSFNIAEADKIAGNSNTWFAKQSVQNTNENKIRVLLDKQINNEWQLADGILSVSGNNYSNEVDAQDALKVTNFNENIQFRNGTNNLAIEYQSLPTATIEQPIRLTGTTATSYRLRVRTEGFVSLDVQPILQDTQSGTNHLIPTDGTTIEIPFTGVVSTTSTPDNRFKIVYQQVLGVEQPINNTLQVYPNPVTEGQFVIALPNSNEVGSYEITNYLGQVVQKGNLTAGNTNVSIASQAVGVYLVRVQQNGEVYTTKIVKK